MQNLHSIKTLCFTEITVIFVKKEAVSKSCGANIMQPLNLLESPSDILTRYWHHSSFRGEQEAVIKSVLQGNDTLALLPTGGGKSICFQVPALMKDGICLVISPLIALMKDQVENLQKRGIPALALHSGLTFYEVNKALEHAEQGDCKFLYLSPERLESYQFKEHLHKLNINLIAVDEAHCVSQWGYDFRPSYQRIAGLRQDLPDVPILALTASATPVVQEDIVSKLGLKQVNIFHQSFERANLSYSVFQVDSKISKTEEILRNVPGSCIVYCRNRRQTKNVADLLSLQNISADFYHAGLSQDDRNQKQNAWIHNKTRVIVCTNAFGMGIDKPDVRTVIHYDVPDCVESYYQEAGRAGRDGKKAYAVLLYQTQDAIDLGNLPNIRYPAIPEIKRVYQCLADYLQIPVGLGEGNYYDFDLTDFVKKFKLDILLVIHVLKVLEQEGHLTFNESIFLPSQVLFTADRNSLKEVENSHPQIDTVMKCLLRTYEGIYDNRVSINEKQMAKLVKLPYDKIYADLHQLQAFGLIEYWPRKETPQINFLYNRSPAQSLHINQDAYFQRRKLYISRIELMLQYLHLDKECRSGYISRYFGDLEAKDCGICDNCLAQKKTELTASEFKRIEQLLYFYIPPQGIILKELLNNLKAIPQDHFWKVLQFLQGEDKLKIDERTIVFVAKG